MWRQLIPLNDKTAFAVREQAGHSLKSSLQVCHDDSYTDSQSKTSNRQWRSLTSLNYESDFEHGEDFEIIGCINVLMISLLATEKTVTSDLISSPITIGWLLHWLYYIEVVPSLQYQLSEGITAYCITLLFINVLRSIVLWSNSQL